MKLFQPIVKPTDRELAAAGDRANSYWYVKRYNMWKPTYCAVSRTGAVMGWVIVLLGGLIALTIISGKLTFTVGGIFFTFLALFRLWVVKYKTFPEVERLALPTIRPEGQNKHWSFGVTSSFHRAYNERMQADHKSQYDEQNKDVEKQIEHYQKQRLIALVVVFIMVIVILFVL